MAKSSIMSSATPCCARTKECRTRMGLVVAAVEAVQDSLAAHRHQPPPWPRRASHEMKLTLVLA